MSSPIGMAAALAPHSSSHTSGAAIAVAVLAGLLALACLAWALARLLAYQPRWSLSMRHAVAEASFRASSTWEEFGDWVRSRG